MSRKRPEHQAPPEIYYDQDEALKYTNCTRIIEIQRNLSERALELLALPPEKSCLILDLGCGSGLSGQVLSEHGHSWIGIDISTSMLDVASLRIKDSDSDADDANMSDSSSTQDSRFSEDTNLLDGNLILGDFGDGVPLRAGSIDGVISISALQWLCNADRNAHQPWKRMQALFTTLFATLVPGGRAVFQFYPENSSQIELLTNQAVRAGFTGGLVIDFPNSTKAKKLFLCLFAGGRLQSLPEGLTDNIEKCKKKRKPQKKSREWILAKKERWRRKGRDNVRPDTKYTGRRRCGKF
ncbi:hypothetical protein GJ496_001714 [Pomphorhynchus laevis]|nr:hypothetical protein GJ496_001714 [Pomphorhynchus laevis]